MADEVRVVAVDPTTKGFGYVVMEGPERMVDWGVQGVGREKNAECLRRLEGLLRFYRPEALVVESHQRGASRRCPRVEGLIRESRRLAEAWQVQVFAYSRAQVREVFAPVPARTKHQIAAVLADRYPELAPRLPPFRRPWMSEDDRMGIFDAASLAVAYFHSWSQGEKAP